MQNRHHYHKRHSRQQMNVEVLAVIDYGIYKRWYDLSSKRTHADKQANAIDDIKYYFTQIYNDIDTRFSGIDSGDYKYNVFLSALHIHTTHSSASFVEDLVMGGKYVDSDALLGELHYLV